MRLKGKASVRKFYYSVVLSAAILYSFSGHAQSIDETYKQGVKGRRRAERLRDFNAGHRS